MHSGERVGRMVLDTKIDRQRRSWPTSMTRWDIVLAATLALVVPLCALAIAVYI